MQTSIDENIITFTAIKNFSYLGVIFINLNPESYVILGLLMIVDTITGIVRSGIVNGWRTVTSHIASVGILAKMMLLLVPFVLAVSAHAVGIEINFIAKAALNILILSETYSILSNIQSARLKREIPEFDAVNYSLESIRAFLEKNIKIPDNK